jgi:hypothetical protein
MADRYIKEHKKVLVEYEKHPEYRLTTYDAINIDRAISMIKNNFTNISNGVYSKKYVKDFEEKLKEMRDIIDNMQKETNKIYHKIK